ncbi:hypothetical protein [Vibrio sp. 1CM23M]|uniref:hypothetical protein n=1 Tax=Vibrio sp. 1CM23M TaxID=2929164 RepID=UPI0020C124D7|nr:hypothetical protein [Vibrio sp. 1CM23M]MCK8072457.1 hypothetical protein [Vibrio sp. 1CM23M]
MNFIIKQIKSMLDRSVNEDCIYDFVESEQTYLISFLFFDGDTLLLKVDFDNDSIVNIKYDLHDKLNSEFIDIYLNSRIPDFGLKKLLKSFN